MSAGFAAALGLLIGLLVGGVAGLLVQADTAIKRQLRAYGVTVVSARLLGRAARVLRAVELEPYGLPVEVAAAARAWVADYDASLTAVGNAAGGRAAGGPR